MRPPLVIQSRNNARIQHLASLKLAKARRASGQFLVEGWHEVKVALETGLQVCSVVSTDAAAFDPLQATLSDEVETLLVSPGVFEKLSMRQHPDGLLMACRQPELPSIESLPETAQTVLILDGLEKPGNHGAILRSAAAFGVDAVVLSATQSDPFHPNVIRNSRGHSLRIAHFRETAEATYHTLLGRGFTLAVASPHATQHLLDVALPNRIAIVLGAEHEGVSSFWDDAAILRFRIPMTDTVDSLNVAVSASIVLYEVFKQKKGKP